MTRDTSQAMKDEIAKDKNKPIFLFDAYLDEQTLRYCSWDKDVDFFKPEGEAGAGDPQTYTALGLSIDPIKQDRQTLDTYTTLKVDNVNMAMSGYAQGTIFSGRRITIRLVMADLLDSADNAIYFFKKGIMDRPQIQQYHMELTIRSKFSIRREAPAYCYQIGCNWRFGSTECGVDLNATENKKTGTCDADCTTSIIKDAERTEETDYWEYGIVEFASGENDGEKREITASESGQFTLDFVLPHTPAVGDTYTIWRGCDKMFKTCKDKYNNQDKFSGFPTLPQLLVRR